MLDCVKSALSIILIIVSISLLIYGFYYKSKVEGFSGFLCLFVGIMVIMVNPDIISNCRANKINYDQILKSLAARKKKAEDTIAQIEQDTLESNPGGVVEPIADDVVESNIYGVVEPIIDGVVEPNTYW